MDDEAVRAVEQAKRLREDAATFHHKSIPLPFSLVSKLIALAERVLPGAMMAPKAS
ncbi:hypothetical protein [Sphingomonas oryzagri]